MTLDDFLRTLETLIDDQESQDDAPGEGNFGCEDCRNCNHCRFCIGCDSCEDCTYCNESIDCMSCTQSKRCVSCEKVSYCEDCRDCKTSRYLTLCVACKDCVHCLACVGLEGGEFYVLNEKRTRKEYFAVLRQVQELMQDRMVAGWRPPGIGLASEIIDAIVAERDVELSAAPWLEELRPPGLRAEPEPELELPRGRDPRELDFVGLTGRERGYGRESEFEHEPGPGARGRGHEREPGFAAREPEYPVREPGYAGRESEYAGRERPGRGDARPLGADLRRREVDREFDRVREPDYEPPRRLREPRRPEGTPKSGRAHADGYPARADQGSDAGYGPEPRLRPDPRLHPDEHLRRGERDAWPRPREDTDAPHSHDQQPTQPFEGRRGLGREFERGADGGDDWDARPLARETPWEDSRERTVARADDRRLEVDAPGAREREPSSPWVDDAHAQAQRRAKRGSLRRADRPKRKPSDAAENTGSGSHPDARAPERTGTHTGTGLRLGRKPKRKS